MRKLVNHVFLVKRLPRKQSFEPLRMSELLDSVWTELNMDLCGPYPNGQYILVVMNEYSRYPVVEALTTVSARSSYSVTR